MSNNTLDTSVGSGIIINKYYDNFSLFKYKKESRFFNNGINNNINNINIGINKNEINDINIINIDISDNLKNIIDNVLLIYWFFKRFNNFFKLNDLENYLCKKLYKETNDDNIKFVFDNIY